MQAAVLHAPGDLRIEETAPPLDLDRDEVLVKVMSVGVCGSDVDRVMRTGTYSFPMIPGHEFCGIIEALGADDIPCRLGDRVVIAPLIPCFRCEFCRRGQYGLCNDYDFLGSRANGGFAQYVRVPFRNVLPLPQSIGFNEGAVIEPAAIALHGIAKLCIMPRASVAVLGCGTLGLLAVQIAKIVGATELIAIDVDANKLSLAGEVGSDYCLNAASQDIVSEVRKITKNRGVDFSIETAGSNATRDQCIQIVKKQGTVLLFGTAHSEVVFSPSHFEAILRKELKIVGTWNSYSVPFPGHEWHTVIRYIGEKKVDLSRLISHVFPLDQAPRVLRNMFARRSGFGKVIFTPNE